MTTGMTLEKRMMKMTGRFYADRFTEYAKMFEEFRCMAKEFQVTIVMAEQQTMPHQRGKGSSTTSRRHLSLVALPWLMLPSL